MSDKVLTLSPIGRVCAGAEGFSLEIFPAYRAGLKGLEGFSHLNVLWWFGACDTPAARASLEEAQPYRRSPERLGVFATRSPRRPNPIALTPIYVLDLDPEKGLIRTPFIDAEDQSPILDIKPYHPSLDRVREVAVPTWCLHWPSCYEDSARFDWVAEFGEA